MKANDPLYIPPAVLALTDATASEKMLLALYVLEPKASNHRALKVLSVGESGLKKIKRRLIAKGLLRSTINGWKVLVPGLTPAPDDTGSHKVSKSDATEKANKVAPLRKLKSIDQILQEHDDTIERFSQYPAAHPSTLLRVTENTMREIQSDVPEGPLKDLALEQGIERCNAWYCLDYAQRNLPLKQSRECDRLIADATPEQLAKLRVGIEHAQLTGGKPTLLLAELSGKNK